MRVLERGVTVIIDADDPAADPAEVALLRRDGIRMLVVPLVAKARRSGWSRLLSRSFVRWDAQQLEVARTVANEAAMALENARGCMRTPASAPTAIR